MKCLCVRLISALGFMAVLLAIAPARSTGQTAPRPNAAHTPAAVSAANPAQKYKAIWEPMNYPDDIYLQDVYFANDKVGWVAGGGGGGARGGFILHTTDGGQHWDLQLGDPHSNTPEVNRLRFLDATHGWAMQGSQLIRTMDGTTWQTIGPLPGGMGSAVYQFMSVQDGFEIEGGDTGATIYATHDGGHNWKPVYECATTLQVNGLTRNTNCRLIDLHFVSLQVGYAVGGGDNWAAIVKTSDGGATWKVIFASTDLQVASTVFFTDENNGVVRLWDNRVLITADGGQTWRGATGTADAAIKFADPEVGWSCNLQGYVRCSYTVDGGKNWISRNFAFPSDINGYNIPRRDVIYAVGDHGMIYRYRVVPADFMVKGMIDAPLMPAYGGALNDELDHMRAHCKEIQAKLASASGATDPAGPAPYHQHSPYGHLQSVALVSYEAEPQGFSQDTSSPAALNAPASPMMQNCCATQLQNLQTSVGSFSQQVPAFSGRFRNLNLLFVGLNMLTELMSKAHAIQASFLALKQAPDLQTASNALQNFVGHVDGTSQTLVSGFQNLTIGDTATAGINGAINNMAGSSISNAAGSTQNSNPAQGTNSTAPGNSQAQNQGTTPANAADNAAQKAKQKVKKLIPF